jgi:purine catabolism regulator
VPPTLQDVVGVRSLALEVRACAEGLSRPVRWVHATELSDPTPYLEGGEFLLTTGMRLSKAAPTLKAYAERLLAAGVVGLGFGVGRGLTHESVPKALITACDKVGMPLLEIPESTPFIQVTKVVSDLIAAEEREQLARSLEAQRALTRAALGPDRAAGVLARLAREVGGWALVMGPRGDVVHATPPAAAARAAELGPEVDRLRPKGMRAGSSTSAGGERVTVQPLGVQGRPRGYLAVGAPEPWNPAFTGIINIAVSLLSLEGERGSDDRTLHRAVRAASAALILEGHLARLPVAELGWAGLVEAPLTVLVGRGPTTSLADVVDRIEEVLPTSLVAVIDDEVVVALSSANGDEQVALRAIGDTRALRLGRASCIGLDELADAVRRARQAAASPSAAAGVVSDYGALAGVGLLDLVDPDAADGFSDAVLAPITASPAADDLLASLDAWLSRHGQWDAAAQDLGVHRHTLRHRIRRIEQMLDRSLDDPAVRMEMWFALRRRAQRTP